MSRRRRGIREIEPPGQSLLNEEGGLPEVKGVLTIMVPKTTDAKALRKYLLGDLSTEDQEAFELWLMSEDDAYDMVLAAEDDLIDEFLAGKLSVTESQQFHNHFLIALERQRKLEFSRIFREYANRKPVPAVPTLPAPARSFWKELGALCRLQPAYGAVSAALILLMIGGGYWSGVSSSALRLDSTKAALQQAETQRHDLQLQIDEIQATSKQLSSQLAQLDNAFGDLQSVAVSGSVVALNLSPILTRSSNDDLPTAQPTPATHLIQFVLPLLDDNYPAYSVALVDGEGKRRGPRQPLAARTIQNVKAIVVTFPPESLPAGDYSFELSGITNSDETEAIGQYYFRVR